MGIAVERVCKQFGSFTALDQVNAEIKTGSLVALLGPSGSGKSTLLRVIAGLERPDSGRVMIAGRDVTNSSVQDRRIGFVFQHYALFKHMTVHQNIAFGLEISKWAKTKIQRRVDELLALVQMAGFGDRYPSQLSGGQRQRIALARALALQPQLLLLDEPFGALDARVRKDLRNWLRRLHDEVHVTTLFVTHDQEEAMSVADEIVVMNGGRVEQIGSPPQIYDDPTSPFVMSFIGPVNVVSSPQVFPTTREIPQTANLFLRPHDIVISLAPEPETVPAIVARIIYLGWEVQLELTLEDGERFTSYLSRDRFAQLQPATGQRVHIKPKKAKTFALQSA